MTRFLTASNDRHATVPKGVVGTGLRHQIPQALVDLCVRESDKVMPGIPECVSDQQSDVGGLGPEHRYILAKVPFRGRDRMLEHVIQPYLVTDMHDICLIGTGPLSASSL